MSSPPMYGRYSGTIKRPKVLPRRPRTSFRTRVRASPQVWTQFSTTREIGLNKHDSQKSAELNNPERGTVEQGSQVEQSVAPVKIIEARSVREADIHVLEEIGRGSHGCCYKVVHGASSQVCDFAYCSRPGAARPSSCTA